MGRPGVTNSLWTLVKVSLQYHSGLASYNPHITVVVLYFLLSYYRTPRDDGYLKT
jgi:hypothetical protein